MHKFYLKEGEKMEQILNTQLFGLVTIILFYNIGLFIQKKARNPICNGLLISIILIIVFLSSFINNLDKF